MELTFLKVIEGQIKISVCTVESSKNEETTLLT